MDPTLHNALAATAFLISIAFCLSTFERWLMSRSAHQGAWTASLALFAAAAGTFWYSTAAGWTDFTFRLFFYFGAIANVPLLALGTMALMSSPRVTLLATRITVVFVVFAAGVLAAAPISGDVASESLPKGSDHFDTLPRLLAAVGSGVGASIVIGGAIFSAYRLMRSRTTRRLPLGNVFIAIGAIVLSASGIFSARFGELTAFSISLTLGITLIFAGFLIAGTRPSRAKTVKAQVD
ncbi:MAG: hypothetical protein ACC652_00815 [Acidimicrobiales bacterium]